MRVAHINVTATLSTGRIAVDISRVLEERGHKALVAFGRGTAPAQVPYLRVGSAPEMALHLAWARLTDRSGFAGRTATRAMVKKLDRYRPDIVHLHNLHGYYLHLPTLFQWLAKTGVPVVWTLHDCWAFTGHCAYYTMANGDASRREGHTHRQRTTRGCDRYKKGCGHCPLRRAYPASLLVDQSARNWREKKALVHGLRSLWLVTPSRWLAGEVKQSFLSYYPVRVIPNGVDLTAFRPCEDAEYLSDVWHKYHLDELENRKILLGVASVWEERKGLADFFELASLLGDEYRIVLVGLSPLQREMLPMNVIGLSRTENLRELCALYTAADLYLSLSHEETMGMTLIEAMACGTQVLCYDATAMPESVTPAVGAVVPLGNLQAVAAQVNVLCQAPKDPKACRKHARLYDKALRFGEYVDLYEEIEALMI
ncbi:MAG: glycosyltransferase [Clostridiales bacterium]|nr:glycosyltransferase [Clostridiales bacterium]